MGRIPIVGKPATKLFKIIASALMIYGIILSLSFIIVIVGLALPIGLKNSGIAWMPIFALIYGALTLLAIIQCWRQHLVSVFVAIFTVIPVLSVGSGIIRGFYHLLQL